MPTIHSLADLRTLVPRDIKPTTVWSPIHPCARCGGWVKYTDAVRAEIGPGHFGFCHLPELCDPAAVAEKARRDATVNRGREDLW